VAHFLTADLANVVLERSRPGITMWNRLEGRPRAARFDRALRAEVRDPLWMLTRQWQMGEFRGDDAGSPIEVKVRVETTRLRKYQSANGPVEEFTDAIPLEAHVERMPVRFSQRANNDDPPHGMALDLRLLLGRQWLKMIDGVAPAAAAGEFVSAYAVHSPDPTEPLDTPTTAHPEAWAGFAAVAGRRMDGAALRDHLLESPGNHASDGIASLAGMDAVIDPIAKRWLDWFGRLFYQPDGPGAWVDDRLEYRFAASAPTAPAGATEKVLVAEEYFHGHLDWFNFDVDPDRTVLGASDPAAQAPERTTLTMLPTQATFNGMPNSRWWRFEDSRTNFGDIKPDTTDLAKLLLIEFGLVYANDWFLVPFTLPAGSIAEVKGMAVRNVFGERTWVTAAGSGDDEDWQRWAMFLLSTKGEAHVPADLSLVLPPSAQKVLEGPPLEEVLLGRDEMANMVWAIERTIPLPTGEPKGGREAAYETRAYHEAELERALGAPPEPLPPAEDAKIRYQVMSSVPEHWIPMLPTHIENDNRQVQLTRGAMLRIMVGDTALEPARVRPRTSIMRQGLEESPMVGYALHEEEVPRAGVRLTQSFQRTRWTDGRAWTWLGVRKQTGRGEGSSGLAFDRLVDVPPKAT
jgi:hypothetical protein